MDTKNPAYQARLEAARREQQDLSRARKERTRAVSSGAAEFGIGRIPADIDAAAESLARGEAAQTMQRMASHGEHVGFAPAGTTEAAGDRDDTGRCERCGRTGWWNPGAGQTLCGRHWDEY